MKIENSNSKLYAKKNRSRVLSNRHTDISKSINFDETNLVTLDQTSIRKSALGQCQKTLKKIDKAKQEIDQFEKIDKPAYEHWINQNFGELIQRIRTHNLEIQTKRAFIDEVQEEAFIRKITFIEAFKIIKYKKDHPEEFPPKDENFEKDTHWGNENVEEDEEDLFREDLNDFFKKFNSKFNMNEEEFENFRNNIKISKMNKNSNFDIRLKERYRLIAQKLHPDKNQKSTPMEKELWYEALEAYKEKDLEKLDFIIALYNIRFGFIGIDSTISDLKFANSKLEKSLKQFSQFIRRAKSEPSWLFLKLKPSKLDSLKKEAAREFKDYEKNTNLELKELNNILEKWEKGSAQVNNKSYPRSSQRNNDDDFLNFYVNF